MRFHNPRIVWSVAWGIAALLLCVLWIRSYSWMNQAQYKISDSEALVVLSAGGTISAAAMETSSPINSSFYSTMITSKEINDYQRMRWQSTFSRPLTEIRIPTWFAAAACSIIATVTWLPRKRFSLFALLIATTFVAVVLELIVWLR